MKKFSKILTRRLARGQSSASDVTDSGPPTRESSPDVHQLPTRRQRSGGDVRRRRRQIQQQQSWRSKAEDHDEASGRFIVDEDSVCPNCAAIDFPSLLDWKPGKPRPWVSLAHTLVETGGDEDWAKEAGRGPSEDESTSATGPPTDASTSNTLSPSTPASPAPWTSSPCAYCAFFRTMIGSTVPQDGSGNFTPYLRIRQAFERWGVSDKHDLGRAVLIEVMTRNRALPWGYLIRAADDEADVAGYQGDSPLLRGRTVPGLLDPEVPRTWIDFCKAHHEHEGCELGLPPVKGLKLVDCTTRQCVEAEHLEQAGLEYVALSYVWGGKPDEFFNDRDRLPEKLPLLFADAISLTISLGYRYIWIDRFCFPHSDSTRRRAQVGLVGDIYAHSALTLVVAAGNSAQEGIPGISIDREEQLSLKTPTGLFTTTLLRPDIEVGSSTWTTRAWTFQEGILARRRLVLTPSQAYFQCRALQCIESVSAPLRLAAPLNFGRVFPSEGAGAGPGDLTRQIRAYMSKELSLPADRLDAFRGILRAYADIPRAVGNLLGLPLFDPDDFAGEGVISQTDRLSVGLSWMPDAPLTVTSSAGAASASVGRHNHTPTPLERCGPFPSWTWVAWGLQPGSYPLKHNFQFHLVGETSPVAGGVRATPGMEVSLGFADGMVMSWEIDGEAIARKGEDVTFLRLTTFCFDISVRRIRGNPVEAGGGGNDLPPPPPVEVEAPLNASAKDAITRWVTQALPHKSANGVEDESSPATVDNDNEDYNEDLNLAGVLIAGRGWKGVSPTAGFGTVLVCGRRGFKPDGQLLRVGLLGVSFSEFVRVDGEKATMKGVETEGGEKKDLQMQLREVDIY